MFYRTYMNNLAISPYIGLYALQNQNVKREVVKKVPLPLPLLKKVEQNLEPNPLLEKVEQNPEQNGTISAATTSGSTISETIREPEPFLANSVLKTDL
jgi:hypothetical protein